MPRALVTGGNRGIGEALCHGLAKAGLAVVVGARHLTDAKAVADQIGGEAIALDVTDRACIESAAKELGDIDVLVNNAGVLNQVSLLGSDSDFDVAMDVMVRGPFDLMRALVPGMVRRGFGRVVNVSSNWGSFAEGLEGPGAYGVAKAALNALTVKAASEVPPSVKINAMCPGWVRTRMGGASAKLTPEEGAATGLWLATLDETGPTGGFFQAKKRIDW